MMKYIIITIIVLVVIFFVSKDSISATEYNHYKVVKKIDNCEIRLYKDLIYASYKPKNKNDRDNSFRNIADFIFGNNKNEEKIAMTSPVVIKLHNDNEMAFIMPNKYDINSLPKPKNTDINIYTEKSSMKAAITYSGYTSSKKEAEIIKELKEILKKEKLEHNNDFEVLVYNSPWKLINRKNEIVVSIKSNKMKTKKTNESKIYFGSGCFWCTEAIFEDVIGVSKVVSGYSGGTEENPNYTQVSNGLTSHAEVCEITYDNNKISLEDLLEIFYLTHDPTTLNRQGNDIGKHYRSIILYSTDSEYNTIQGFTDKMNLNLFENKIVTEISKFNIFYEAEDYHQNYFKLNREQGYCSSVINPKVNKAKKNLNKFYKN